MKQRIIVAGSRNFNNYPYLESVLDRYFAECGNDRSQATIISGTARGADAMGERYAITHGIPLIRCPADWNRYGKSAGYRRNEQMAILSMSDNCQGVLLAFWDGISRSTRHMIDLAYKHGVIVHICSI